MDEGQIIGLTITIIAVIALVAGLVWLFVWGSRPEWPDAEARSEVSINGIGVVVLWGRGSTPGSSFALRFLLPVHAVQAVQSLRKAWTQSGRPPYKFGTFGVYVLNKYDFEASITWGDDPSKVQAYLSSAVQRLGDPPPMVVLRSSLVQHAIDTGQPIIHELLHDIGGLRYDRGHKDPLVWDMPGHEDSIEALAQQHYVG